MLIPTRVDLPESVRQNVVNLLQDRVVNGIDLMLQVKHAHWNVRGPDFFSLHKLFDLVHEELEEGVDLMAERIAQFGGITPGTCQNVEKRTSMPVYPLTWLPQQEHVEQISHALACFGKSIREAMVQTNEWNDLGTSDILTEISRNVDKNIWYVESHLVEQKARAKSAKGAA